MKINAKNSQCITENYLGQANSGERTARRARCSNRGKRAAWKDQAAAEVDAAAAEIVRANVEKAKAGSLSHTKWLLTLADQSRAEQDEVVEMSLAAILLKQLKANS